MTKLSVVVIVALVLFAAWALSGCVNASMTCPDGKSTVTYKGLALTGATSVSCVGSTLGGDTIQVTGLDIAALAAAVAPLVGPAILAAHPAPTPVP